MEKTEKKRNKQIRKPKDKEWLVYAGTIAGLVAATVGIFYLGGRLGDNAEKGSITKVFNYSSRWLESASDAILDEVREKVRVAWVNSGIENRKDWEIDYLYRLLNSIDREISKRAWAGKEYGYPVRREHGWYLPNND